MWVYSLGWEDPLEKKMAAHSSILTWSTPWTEELGRAQSIELQKVDTNEATQHAHIATAQNEFNFCLQFNEY